MRSARYGDMEANVLPLNYSGDLFTINNLKLFLGLANTIKHHWSENGLICTTKSEGVMRIHRQRYHTGSVRKVPRAHGFAWEFRYYYTDPAGQRKLKVQTFDAATYKTERDVRKAVETQMASLNANTLPGRAGLRFAEVIDRYLLEGLPHLKHSTQMTNTSLIELYVRQQWGEYSPADIEALEVKQLLDSLPVGAASKARARNMISKLLDLSMLWKYIPVARNPMQLLHTGILQPYDLGRGYDRRDWQQHL